MVSCVDGYMEGSLFFFRLAFEGGRRVAACLHKKAIGVKECKTEWSDNY